MYLDFFGLKKPPFRITPDTNVFFEGCDRGATLNALCYVICQGEGIVKVIGEVGTGKTMLCRMLPHKLPDTVELIYLAHPNLSPADTLRAIAQEMGLDVSTGGDKLSVTSALHEALLKKHAAGKQVVVLVEEAQSVPIETLEEIRLLSNLETDEEKLLQIVLFGQPELDCNLSEPRIRQLRERISHNIRLDPLDMDDIGSYLNFRLRATGYTGPDLFSGALVKEVAMYSCGLVRRVNIIADKTLLAAFVNGRHTITVEDIRNAARESEFRSNKKWWSWAKPVAASVVLGLGVSMTNLEHNDTTTIHGLEVKIEEAIGWDVL